MLRLNISTQSQVEQLRSSWKKLQNTEPDLPNDEFASRLGVSEAELVASRVGCGVIRLAEDSIADIFMSMPEVGRVMVFTSNNACHHLKKGWFDGVLLGKTIGEVVGGAVDLRLYLDYFKYAFVVKEKKYGVLYESIQFFDVNGVAVHKIYKIEQTNTKLWQRLINTFAALDQTPFVFVDDSIDQLALGLSDSCIDTGSLLCSWCENCSCPYEIRGLLKRHNVTRQQSLRIIGKEFAQRAENYTAEFVLNKVAATGLPIKIVAESNGLIQTHTGVIQNFNKMGWWINVLDEDFNLHLRSDLIAETWVVKKPTMDGVATSIEMYDDTGKSIVSFYGQSMPGKPEMRAWTELADCMVIPDNFAV